MTITNGYCTVEQLMRNVQISAGDYEDINPLEKVIEGVSGWVDAHCHRQFYETTEARYFTAEEPDYIRVDDLLSVSELATDDLGTGTWSTTWDSSYYTLAPYNAASKLQPYSIVEITPQSIYTFQKYRKGIKITGSWGWVFNSECPHDVREACILQAARVFKRAEAVFGVQGTNAIGQSFISSVPVDNDVKGFLENFVKRF